MACMVICICAMCCEANVWLLYFKIFIALTLGSVGYNMHVPLCMCGVRRQFARASSLLPPSVSQRLNSDHQARHQAPLPVELPHGPNVWILTIWHSCSFRDVGCQLDTLRIVRGPRSGVS